jgi:uncharacterized RDD family membrane protein YckC
MDYFLVINGKPEGPLSLDELKARHLSPGDFVKTADMHDFKEVQEMPELRTLFGFKKPPLLVQYYGSFDQRLLATAIDWFIIAGVFIFVAFVLAVFIPDKDARIQMFIFLLIPIPLVRLVYNTIMEAGKKQGTVGKQLVKITVCDIHGDRLHLGRSAFRNMAKIFSVATLFGGYLISFFDKKHQCLHDQMADTMVIKDRLM